MFLNMISLCNLGRSIFQQAGRIMNIQTSIVINRSAEAVFAYLASEEHIAVLGQQVEYEQEAGEGSPKESRPQGESEMKDEGKVEARASLARTLIFLL
jgi:hypothetical protein